MNVCFLWQWTVEICWDGEMDDCKAMDYLRRVEKNGLLSRGDKEVPRVCLTLEEIPLPVPLIIMPENKKLLTDPERLKGEHHIQN